LLYEFIFKYYNSPNIFIYNSGQIIIKLCYSYISAFIFYFLVVHITKENKKAKVYRQLNNKILLIESDLFEIIITILDSSNYQYNNLNGRINFKFKDLKEKDFIEACKRINPLSPVSTKYLTYHPKFNDWYEYLTFKSEKISKIVNDIFLLNESLDTNLIDQLTYVDDEISKLNYNRIKFGNKDLSVISTQILQTYYQNDELYNAFSKTYIYYKSEYKYFHYKHSNKTNS